MLNIKRQRMGQLNMKLILHNTKARYHNAIKAEKGLTLDQFCQQTNMHRKSVIRLFNRQDSMVLKKKRAGNQSTSLMSYLVCSNVCGLPVIKYVANGLK